MVAGPIRYVRLRHPEIIAACKAYIDKQNPPEIATKYIFALAQEQTPMGVEMVIDCTLSEVRHNTGDPLCTG